MPRSTDHTCIKCNDTGVIALRSSSCTYAFPGPLPGDARHYCEADCWDCGVARRPKKSLPKIVANFVYPPIPIRSFDWSAHFDGDEPDDDGHMRMGYGRTEQEAIDDLVSTYIDTE